MKLITTSWDDGYILDFKLAEMLQKYNLPGTFYIPKANVEYQVMEASKIVELAKEFEIGGHTMNHIRLYTDDNHQLQNEIKGCYNWLHELLGYPPVSFCFPDGFYSRKNIAVAFESGFKIARTTHLLSIERQIKHQLMPTTLQVYEHSAFTYAKHLAKRRNWKDMMCWLSRTSLTNLQKLTESYLDLIEKNDGCFHLWGHSWEIEQNQLWNKLEAIFKVMSNRPNFTYVTNKDIFSI